MSELGWPEGWENLPQEELEKLAQDGQMALLGQATEYAAILETMGWTPAQYVDLIVALKTMFGYLAGAAEESLGWAVGFECEDDDMRRDVAGDQIDAVEGLMLLRDVCQLMNSADLWSGYDDIYKAAVLRLKGVEES